MYLGAVFILGGVVDLLLILGTNKLTGSPPCIKQALAGAFIGGVYRSLCAMPGLYFLGNLFWRAVFLILACISAFGWDWSTLRSGAIFVLLNMALGGFAAAGRNRNFMTLCLCAAAVLLLCRMGGKGIGLPQKCIPAELTWNGRNVKLYALHDTGNTLRDPLTGEQVLVCGADVGAELLNVPEDSFRDPGTLVCSGSISGLRLIPFHSVGQPQGLMALLRLKEAKVGKTVCDPLVAIAPYRFGNGEVYRMLVGGMYS